MILVVCDLVITNIDSTYEMLGKANFLAQTRRELVSVLFIGSYNPCLFLSMSQHGAQKIFYCEHSQNGNYIDYANIVKTVIIQHDIQLILFSDSIVSKAIAATLATQIGAGLIADCIDIDINADEKYRFTRAALNSSVIVDIICTNTRYEICTVKRRIFHNNVMFCANVKTSPMEIINYDSVQSTYSALELLTRDLVVKDKVDIGQSKIIMAAGRGVEKNDLGLLHKIADRTGAQVGGTRILVEQGLLAKSRQIGQSGINVVPELYIAFGISGASQHIVGMQCSKTIIAVNHDIQAPIFRYADYAIVADTHSIILNLFLTIERSTII